MKKEIITITGALGSGKSSTADKVAATLSYRRFSSGDFMRTIAGRHSVSLGELQVIAEKDSSIDIEIDGEVRKAGELEQIVIDSRLAFHWIPDSFKIYLTLDPKAAADRVFKHMQEEGRVGETAESVNEAFHALSVRRESEIKRYKTLYDIDPTDSSNFDLVIDTGSAPLLHVAEHIVQKYRAWLANG